MADLLQDLIYADPRTREPTLEEIHDICEHLTVGVGLWVPTDERKYVIRYNGVILLGNGGKTRFRTAGAAKVSLQTSYALRAKIKELLAMGRGIKDYELAYRGSRGTSSVTKAFVDHMLKSGKLRIELE